MSRIGSPARADVAIAAVLAAFGVVEAALAGAPASWFAGVLAATLPLAWRRRRPAAVIVWVLALTALAGVAGAGPDDVVLPLPLLVVLGYTAGRHAPDGRRATAAALAIGAVVATAFGLGRPAGNSAVDDLVALVVVVGGSAAAGHLVRTRSREARRLEQLAGRLAAERDARARAAVAQERARMAREIHDIVAHGVSLIAVQAAAAQELLGRDEARARASLEAVQDAARGALAEMRRLLSVLRADDDPPALAPQPGMRSIAELVEQARAGGLPVRLHEQGAPRKLPAGLDLSAYRIVQEALTNVRKHAGAVATDVRVSYGSQELVVEVVNERSANGASGEPDGYGLVGMQERARIYGGTLEAGPEAGRYVVRARLPLEGGEG